ncbi:hypothetical protein [Corynebacterium anserum]|nr:hypothetical protein [Corynebacterium anserum]
MSDATIMVPGQNPPIEVEQVEHGGRLSGFQPHARNAAELRKA